MGGRTPMPQSERDYRPVTILLADDDAEDRELTRDALQDSRLANEMKFVVDVRWTHYWIEIVELPNGDVDE
jgi:hypothetical protein